MTFSFDTSLAENKDLVRHAINDKVSGSGPLPLDANFSDEELEAIIEHEGTWQRAVANCLEALTIAWVRFPTFQADNFAISRSHIARNYEESARMWRRNYGFPNGATIRAKSVIRIDGYSDDIASDEVDG